MQQTSSIILGSQSPRRKELLHHLGLEFTIQVIPTDESYPEDIALSDVSSFVAMNKARIFPKALKAHNTIITADTIVLCDGEILQKPTSREDAIHILSKLSGKWHQVITGVCILYQDNEYIFKDITQVHFTPMTLGEISFYIDRCQPYDKAGSYGVQEWIGAAIIDEIKGSYFNVMGLPTHLVYRKLVELNILK